MNTNGGTHHQKLALYFKSGSELRPVKDLEVNKLYSSFSVFRAILH